MILYLNRMKWYTFKTKSYIFIHTELKMMMLKQNKKIHCLLLSEQKPAHNCISDLSYSLLYLQMTSRTMTSVPSTPFSLADGKPCPCRLSQCNEWRSNSEANISQRTLTAVALALGQAWIIHSTQLLLATVSSQTSPETNLPSH